MSATLGMKNITVRAFGTSTTVPNNAIAKLMYYLDCVAAVIDYEDRTLTDYQNYDELSGEQLLAVYQFAKLLNPSIFINAGIFIVDQKLLFDKINQFYEINDETICAHVNSEIMIGGKVVKVLKLMACNDTWLSNNYYKPINEIDRLILEIERYRNRKYLNQILTTQSSFEEKPVIVAPKEFKDDPISMTCPFCLKVITTRTESKFNFVACFCCLIFNLLYCCVQICLGKNACCCDIKHKCPNCGKILGYYKSC